MIETTVYLLQSAGGRAQVRLAQEPRRLRDEVRGWRPQVDRHARVSAGNGISQMHNIFTAKRTRKPWVDALGAAGAS
jgi:hypothetical protein